MLIKSSSAPRNDYDSLVKLSYEKAEPIYITRNSEGEMVFLPIEVYEKREAERNRLSGAPTFTTSNNSGPDPELFPKHCCNKPF
ncbi:MAG: type II toxin-antitoxin system Phd/YefM family antitoxin [Syntrophomonas sp.]